MLKNAAPCAAQRVRVENKHFMISFKVKGLNVQTKSESLMTHAEGCPTKRDRNRHFQSSMAQFLIKVVNMSKDCFYAVKTIQSF